MRIKVKGFVDKQDESVKGTESVQIRYFLRVGFRLGLNKMLDPYTGMLFSSRSYPYHNSHQRAL